MWEAEGEKGKQLSQPCKVPHKAMKDNYLFRTDTKGAVEISSFC